MFYGEFFTGWLLFDPTSTVRLANGAPGGSDIWRSTAYAPSGSQFWVKAGLRVTVGVAVLIKLYKRTELE